MGIDQLKVSGYNVDIRNKETSYNTRESKMAVQHINSIYSTMDGGYEAEIDRVNCHTGRAYRIIIQHLGETHLHYSKTEEGCYDWLYDLVRKETT